MSLVQNKAIEVRFLTEAKASFFIPYERYRSNTAVVDSVQFEIIVWDKDSLIVKIYCSKNDKIYDFDGSIDVYLIGAELWTVKKRLNSDDFIKRTIFNRFCKIKSKF